MKHAIPVTLFLVSVFFLTQIVGLLFINADIDGVATRVVDGEETLVVVHDPATEELRPATQGFESVIYLAIGVTIGTLLVLLLMKFGKQRLWRLWFFIAVILTITFALRTVMSPAMAFGIAAVLAIAKMWRPNIITHNLAEVLMYSGIAVLLVPIFTTFWAIILLLLISVYDAFAVWQSRHMIGMAKFMTKSRAFAGLAVPKKEPKIIKEKHHKAKKVVVEEVVHPVAAKHKDEGKVAILGGGDVAFPLIFTGTVMEGLLVQGVTRAAAFWQASVISVVCALGLFYLFKHGKPGKFYPAMPFLTASCLVGWGLLLLIRNFL